MFHSFVLPLSNRLSIRPLPLLFQEQPSQQSLRQRIETEIVARKKAFGPVAYHDGPASKRWPFRITSRCLANNLLRELLMVSTILLLVISNIFMTFAWYGHLKKHQSSPLWIVILISWGIAFFEYCFQVPANRIGAKHGSTYQLKTIQEVITLVVFCVFSVAYLGEPLKWNYLVGFAFIAVGATFVFKPW
jgi:uncharacterized protein